MIEIKCMNDLEGGKCIRKKYTYKNKIPKQLLKANKRKRYQSAFKAKRKPTSNKMTGQKSTQVKPFQKNSLGKRKFSPLSFRWSIPMLILTALVMTIIIIPSLVVVPSVAGDTETNQAVETKLADSEPEEHIESVTVDVVRMRTAEKDIESVQLEEYVAGVVASEMGIDFELEALKAQSVAARTYVVNHLLNQPKPEKANITDSTQHQVYKNKEELRSIWGNNYEENMEKLTSAVEATSGKVITHNDVPIMPAFFSTSNGYTENSEDYWENEFPYLRSVQSKWDEESPKFLDQRVFTLAEVESAFDITLPKDNTFPIEITRTDSERVQDLKLNDIALNGREVREKLDLQSNDFTIEQNNDHLIFTTKGYGHGIGMSQYGANGMAKEGKNFEDIIEYYYQDVNIKMINETAPTLVSK